MRTHARCVQGMVLGRRRLADYVVVMFLSVATSATTTMAFDWHTFVAKDGSNYTIDCTETRSFQLNDQVTCIVGTTGAGSIEPSAIDLWFPGAYLDVTWKLDGSQWGEPQRFEGIGRYRPSTSITWQSAGCYELVAEINGWDWVQEGTVEIAFRHKFIAIVGSPCPQPDLVGVSGIPSTVQPGQAFTVTVTAKNNGAAAGGPDSAINASVLYDGGSHNVIVTGPDDVAWASRAFNYAPGEGTIYDPAGSPIGPAIDNLIEAADDSWASGQQHTMSFTITPLRGGVLYIRVRTTLRQGTDGPFLNDASAEGGAPWPRDQNGWEVRQYAVRVAELADLTITGDEFVPEGSSSRYHATATWTDGTSVVVTASPQMTWATTSPDCLFVNPAGTLLNINSTGTNQTASILGTYSVVGSSRTATKQVTLEGTTPANLPDLHDDGSEYSGFSPISISNGSTLNIYCDIRNSGIADAGPFRVGFYASTDIIIAPADYLIGYVDMSGVTAGNWETCDFSGVPVTHMPNGDYWIGWIIDVDNTVHESNESNNTAFHPDIDLTVTDPRTISGTVRDEHASPLAGVEITRNDSPNTVETQPNGSYSIQVPFRWSGQLVPVHQAWDFVPPDRSFTNLTNSVSDADFVAWPRQFTISGRVTLDGAGLGGVILRGLPGDPQTDHWEGRYVAHVPYDWQGVVTPEHIALPYLFEPASRVYLPVRADIVGDDYVAAPTGSLVVTINPVEAVNSGARWRVNDGNWLESGVILAGLQVGEHAVSFKSLIGWDVPADTTVAVLPHQMAALEAVYSLNLPYALDAPDLPWSTGAPEHEGSSWTAQFVQIHDGTLEPVGVSGELGEPRASVLQTIIEGPVLMTWWWKVEGFLGSLWSERFRVYVNGESRLSCSDNDWTKAAYRLGPGTNIVQWKIDSVLPTAFAKAFLDGVMLVDSQNQLGEALDAPQLTWETGGSDDDAARWWYWQTAETHDGVDAAQSGSTATPPGMIGGGSSWLRTSITGPALVSFWRKVDTAGAEWGFDFSIGEQVLENLTTSEDWTLKTYWVGAGEHQFLWNVWSGVVPGEGTVYLDELTVIPAATGPAALGVALDAEDRVWETYGAVGEAANWQAQTTETHDGIDAARCGSTYQAQGFFGPGYSTLQTVVDGPSLVRFYWKGTAAGDSGSFKFRIGGEEHELLGMGQGADWTLAEHRLESGSHVLRWTAIGDFMGAGGTDCYVDEFFVAPGTWYRLDASVVGNHGAIGPASGFHQANEIVTLTAEPAPGYRVKAWTGTDDNTSTANTNTVTMDEDKTVTVEFEEGAQDSDGDGVPDEFDLCPDTIPGSPVDEDGCPPVIPGDFDRDGDVDLTNFAGFAACFNGPNRPYPDPGCFMSDFDEDGDVDLADFQVFQACFNGPNRPPACLPGPFTVTIETVPVDHRANAGDSRYGGYGSVDYAYNIGKYEVTAGQYAEFLNAVGGVDIYSLYNPEMSRTDYGSGITRSGSGIVGDLYTYSVDAAFVNRPVNYVSWGDAARFANWLHNGQPAGPQNADTTEDGAYDLAATQQYYNPDGTINDWDGLDAALLAVNRNSNWKWAITSEDEWYKAAYHNPTTSSYYDYPTSSNAVPGRDLNDVSGNNANYYGSPFPLDSPYHTTVVGQFHNSASPYGTFDQGGNVWEWNEAVIGSNHGLRGGSFGDYVGVCGLHASVRVDYNPAYDSNVLGFRVVRVSTSAFGSTDKATWITEASDYVLDHMPKVEALMWFNNYKPGVGEPDWRIVPEAPTPPDMNVINAYNNAWRDATRAIELGVYIDGAPADMSKIHWYEQWVSPSPQARIGWYQNLSEPFPTDLVNNVLAHGSTPHIVWQPYDSSKLVTIGGVTYAEDTNNGPSRLWEIVNGDYDFRLMQWASALNDINGEVEISFGHEGNSDSFSWGYLNGHKGNTADLYRDAFQHVVDIFNTYNTKGNVKWVWTIKASWQDDFTAAYPGDAYVDIIGMDGFNWNQPWMDPNSDWDDWREFSEIFNNWHGFSTYQTLLPFDKPMIIGATGSNVS